MFLPWQVENFYVESQRCFFFFSVGNATFCWNMLLTCMFTIPRLTYSFFVGQLF